MADFDTVKSIREVTVRRAVLTSILAMGRGEYERAVQAGLVVRKDGTKGVIHLVDTLQAYVEALRKSEEIAAANLRRIEAQTAVAEQKRELEAIKVRQAEGDLVPADDVRQLVDSMAAVCRSIAKTAETEILKRTPKERRDETGAHVRRIFDQMLTAAGAAFETEDSSPGPAPAPRPNGTANGAAKDETQLALL